MLANAPQKAVFSLAKISATLHGSRALARVPAAGTRQEPQQGSPALDNVREVFTKSTSVLQTAGEKKMTRLSTTAEFGFRPAKLIPSATSEGSVSLGASQRGDRLRGTQTADNPEVRRCGNILFLCQETLDFIKGGS